jgi:hypothetical protein
LKPEQVEAIIESLNGIDRFLRHDIIEVLRAAQGSSLEPQRDFASLLGRVEALRSFGFYYSKEQLALLEQLVDNLQINLNDFIDTLRSASQRGATRIGADENAILDKARTVFSADARHFRQMLMKPVEAPAHSTVKRSLFICYRRADSHWVVDRIYRQLRADFEQVFRDIDSIPLGESFPDLIRNALQSVSAVLVVIGPRWLDKQVGGEARLFDHNDHVRIEIEAALKSSAKVIPVLLSPAQMPSAAELPESIAMLREMNGIDIRPDPDFDGDMKRLTSRLAQ